MIKSDFLVRYREFLINGQKIKKPDDVNLMNDFQFVNWPHQLTFHSDGSKIYSFSYDNIDYKATNIWHPEPNVGYMIDIKYENVQYDIGMDKFIVLEQNLLPVETTGTEESPT